jgi:ABC-type glycerol-3-phosphate transport system permease component
VLPIIFIINNAFKPITELFMYPPRFFVKKPTLQNFYDFFFLTTTSKVPFARYLFNSILVSTVAVILILAISSTTAYAFSKMQFKGRDTIFKIIIISLMFSPAAVSITRYLIISNLGIVNTYWGHILPQLALPVGVFLLKQFMDQIPKPLNEAAKIDGANEFQIFIKIVMPLVLPAVGTVMILSFQAVWGDVTTSTLYMVDESMKTLPYFVGTLTSGLTTTIARQGASAAAGLLLFLPNFIIFAIMQKSMIETMVNSGIK